MSSTTSYGKQFPIGVVTKDHLIRGNTDVGDVHVRFSSSKGGMNTPSEKTIFFSFLFYLHQRTLSVWRCGPSTLLDWWSNNQEKSDDEGSLQNDSSLQQHRPGQFLDDPTLKDKHGLGLGATSRSEFLQPTPEYKEKMQKKISKQIQQAENDAALSRVSKSPSRTSSLESPPPSGIILSNS